MAGLCFHIEADEIDLAPWRHAALVAGDIDTLAIINRTAKPIAHPNDDGMGLCQYANLGQFLDDHRGRSMAYLCAPCEPVRARLPLWQFDHDTDWYVFGPAAGWRREIDTAITAPQSGRTALPAMQVASTVLLHRYWVKHGAAPLHPYGQGLG